jgi:hypothetical protein
MKSAHTPEEQVLMDELREVYAQRDELLAACKAIENVCKNADSKPRPEALANTALAIARAAIAYHRRST